MSVRSARWICRACFGLVFVWNVLCALRFVMAPADFAGAYQLEGVPGEVAVRGMGVAFLMWNATYPLFLWQPERFKVLGWVIAAQQLIGCVGEAFILCALPVGGFELLAASIQRFLIFDAAGLGLMVLSGACFLHCLARVGEDRRA